jgi:hypothetical protein
MAVVDDFYIGRTHIRVHDDYFCRSEEIPVILERISRNASLALQAETVRKAQEKDETA